MRLVKDQKEKSNFELIPVFSRKDFEPKASFETQFSLINEFNFPLKDFMNFMNHSQRQN